MGMNAHSDAPHVSYAKTPMDIRSAQAEGASLVEHKENTQIVPSMTPEQLAALQSVDRDTRWRVAEAYEARRRAGEMEFPATISARLELATDRPDLSDDQIAAVVTSIIFWAASEHNDWLWHE